MGTHKDSIHPREANQEIIHFEGSRDESSCADCRNNRGFSIHHSLIDAFGNSEVVVFAGAGISTEKRFVTPYTLHEEVCAELHLNPKVVAFPDAMQRYADGPNGQIRLIERIRNRIDNVESFPELYDEAVEFHRELATMFMVDTVITTNWDSFFERECCAQPFVFDSDMAFWEAVERRVLKIHGSISNFDTIVATRNSYSLNFEKLRESLIGSRLKTILSTKTIVFCGYSLRDDDFRQIMTFMRESLGAFNRQNYVVTIETSDAALAELRNLGLVPICTDATYFLQNVKAYLFRSQHFIPDGMYDRVAKLLRRVQKEHTRLFDDFNMVDDPEIMYCASYQDGLMHALQRILHRRGSGEYSHLCSVQRRVQGYGDWREKKTKAKKYEDVAYIDGYRNGLLFACLQKDGADILPPLYYIYCRPPMEIENREKFVSALKYTRRNRTHHRAALSRAANYADKTNPNHNKSIVFHHMCQLA